MMPYIEIGRQQTRNEKVRGAFDGVVRKMERVEIPWYRWVVAGVVLVGLYVGSMSDQILESIRHRTSPPLREPCRENVMDFDDIVASKSLKWVHCFDEFLCAKLVVPMDYKRSDPSIEHPVVEIALAMLPGKGHVEAGQFGTSPLLLNPGGPGGSGVQFALGSAKGIQQVVGLDRDIIGFDPRGIGHTTPAINCFSFPGDGGASGREPTKTEQAKGIFHAATWSLGPEAIGLWGSSDKAPAQLNARAGAFVALCGTKDEIYGDNSIFKYVGTAAVARDMLSIVDAWDAWREKEGQSDGFWAPNLTNSSLDTKGQLVYWGFSYGTFLGASFAALFPDRVGRVILDGVVDADFYASPMWDESLLDTDNVESSFFKFCHEAGKRCSFYREGDSEMDLADRFHKALRKLKDNPIVGVQLQTQTPAVVTYEFYHSLIFSALYFPQATFPLVALIMSWLASDNEAMVVQLGGWSGAMLEFAPFCHMGPAPYTGRDAQASIACGDKRYPLNETLPELHKRFEKLSNTSTYADIWASLLLQCNAWPVKVKTDPMPWGLELPKKIKTSFPVLFIGNTADPVTPLSAAVKMALKFEDAGLFEQKSEGHCSLSTVSLCTIAKVRAYFQEGKVPSDGKDVSKGEWDKCERNETPFKPFEKNDWIQTMVSIEGGSRPLAHIEEEAERLEAWKQVQEEAPYHVGLLQEGTHHNMVQRMSELGAWS